MQVISRPALGQVADFGTLYDATTDSFIGNVFRSARLPDDLVRKSTIADTPTVETISNLGYRDKLRLLGLSPDLGASILGYLVDGRVGRISANSPVHFLRRRPADDTVSQAALVHRHLTARESLILQSPSLESMVDRAVLMGLRASHVVVSIDWGAETVVEINDGATSAHSPLTGNAGNAAAALKAMVTNTSSATGSGLEPTFEHLDITVSSNMIPEPLHMRSMGEAKRALYERVAAGLSQHNMGKGYPVRYNLLPISMFAALLGLYDGDDFGPVFTGPSIVPIKPEHLERCHMLFDRLFAMRRQALNYLKFLTDKHDFLSPDYLLAIKQRAQDLDQCISDMTRLYGELISKVRDGSQPPAVLKEVQQQISTALDTGTIEEQREKLEFIAHAVQSGAIYQGQAQRNSVGKMVSQQDQGAPPLYVLSFSQSAMQHDSWSETKALLLELLRERRGVGAEVVIEDFDMMGQRIEAPYITEYRNGTDVTTDLLANRRFLADKNFARYKEDCLETGDVQKPVRRRFIRIPCPGVWCHGATDHSWTCPKCLHPLEYGHSDDYIYCDCGRSHFSNYSFKCKNNSTHGPNYAPFPDNRRFRSLLQSLESSNYVNILILGETGVGKSTFINAFINYLAFETLDDALESDELQWVVPCSFQKQVMDRSRPSSQIIQHKVQVGKRSDEVDGSKGMSATQQTSVYPINFGSKTIRLIDTPGIGDTRGVQFDKKNMADILATLNSYENLHGILILLKSNNARLTITFEFCVKELLTHLHRSAVSNIAFGFTNTRISNYTPGDTFGPLETLLSQQSNVKLSLGMQTAYCFDSESFRYLAANKQGILMENEEDFRRSWKHSREESKRLVEYFESKPPHLVTNTISLNGTRQLILELAKPLAEISQLIRKNIRMSQDRERELADAPLTGAELLKKLKFVRVELRKKGLVRPRTVCTHRDCICEKDDGTGKRVTEYKTQCHPARYLYGVTQEVIGFPYLINCTAFQGRDHCLVCSHSWRQHLHILYEFEEVTATATDPRVEADLAANTAESELRRRGVQETQKRISEYQSEHERVQSAAVEFGLYLKKHSITPYNDVTLAYLDMLINHEKEKIQVGGSKERLEGLEGDRRRHLELVEIISGSVEQPPSPNGNSKSYTMLDEAGVAAKVRELYGLKHFGANLQAVQQTISDAHAATYRERPYRVGAHRQAHVPKRKSHYRRERSHGHIDRPSNNGSGSDPKSNTGLSKVISSFFTRIGLGGDSSAARSSAGPRRRRSTRSGRVELAGTSNDGSRTTATENSCASGNTEESTNDHSQSQYRPASREGPRFAEKSTE